MLRVFFNEAKGTSTALVEDCEFDAMRHIDKIYNAQVGGATNGCCPACRPTVEVPRLEEAYMSNKYTGTVTVREGDTFDKKTGESLAVKKAMANHKGAFRKAIIKWQTAVIKDIMRVSPDTFDESVAKAKAEVAKDVK